MLDIYKFNNLPYLKIELHYQGRNIERKFCKGHPDLFLDYPAIKDVEAVRKYIIANKQPNIFYTIVVFEEGIYIVES